MFPVFFFFPPESQPTFTFYNCQQLEIPHSWVSLFAEEHTVCPQLPGLPSQGQKGRGLMCLLPLCVQQPEWGMLCSVSSPHSRNSLVWHGLFYFSLLSKFPTLQGRCGTSEHIPTGWLCAGQSLEATLIPGNPFLWKAQGGQMDPWSGIPCGSKHTNVLGL